MIVDAMPAPVPCSVRRERMRPAHVYERDEFEPDLYDEQEQLVEEAYGALRTLRLVLANNPAASAVEIPDWLREARFARF